MSGGGELVARGQGGWKFEQCVCVCVCVVVLCMHVDLFCTTGRRGGDRQAAAFNKNVFILRERGRLREHFSSFKSTKEGE